MVRQGLENGVSSVEMLPTTEDTLEQSKQQWLDLSLHLHNRPGSHAVNGLDLFQSPSCCWNDLPDTHNLKQRGLLWPTVLVHYQQA